MIMGMIGLLDIPVALSADSGRPPEYDENHLHATILTGLEGRSSVRTAGGE